MPRPARRALAVLCTAALAALALTAVASAATVTLKCGGKGGRNESSDGSKVCAAQPGRARNLEGVLRDDGNKPVDGKLSVTFSEWIPQGDGAYSVEAFKTVTVSANAAGKFTIPVKTTSEISVAVESVADEKKSISGGAVAEAQVQLELKTTVKKLGGGRVKVTVKGTKQPLKIAITEEYGYEVSGGKLKKAPNGVASFNLGAARGSFEVYVEAGDLTDLFWPVRPSFKL